MRRRLRRKNADREIPINSEVQEALLRQRELFVEKFDREPGPDDPVFFDPDADTPQEIDPEKVTKLMTEAMAAAGLDPALTYAYRQTGMLVTEQNYDTLPADVREEWDAAIAEYNEKTSAEPS